MVEKDIEEAEIEKNRDDLLLDSDEKAMSNVIHKPITFTDEVNSPFQKLRLDKEDSKNSQLDKIVEQSENQSQN